MKNILLSLAKFQSLIKPITKDANNPFYKSKYATLDGIQEHIKPILIECGLVIIQRNINNESGLYVETEVYHVDTAESIKSIFPIIVQKSDAQSYGSAVSYAKRYSLSGLLNLTIQDEDDDGNASSNKQQSIKQPDKWLNIMDSEKNYTKEWINILEAIKDKKINSVSDVRKHYKVSKEVESKILELLNN